MRKDYSLVQVEVVLLSVMPRSHAGRVPLSY